MSERCNVEMRDDGPSGWLNWRAARGGAPSDGSITEFAIFSDAHLTQGPLTLGPYELVNIVGSTGPIGNVEPGLVLRIGDHLPEERAEFDWSRTDTTHYHGGGIADEFAALLSLALGARFKAGNWLREFSSDDDRFGHIWPDGFRRPFLAPPRGGLFRPGGIPMLPGIADTVRIGEAVPYLETYASLSLEDVIPLLRAARRYQEALWIADGDPETSWLHMIGAVETAAARWARPYRLTPEEVLTDAWPELGSALQRVKDFPRALLRDLARIARSGKRFRDFLLTHLPPAPAQRPQHGRLDWEQMDVHLRAVYNARSRALHDGIPLPVPMVDTPRSLGAGEVPAECIGTALAAQGGLWRSEDAPMHLHVFAYIAGEALRTWWMSLTPGGSEHREPQRT